MPIVRYHARNEYGLADPVLYGAVERNDPEALLEGVAMAGLVGVLRQLGDLAEFAAEIFHDLHEEVMVTSARGHTLMLRVQQLEVEFPAVEKDVLSQTCHSNLAPSSGIDWHPSIQMDKNLVTQGDMPRFILNSYEECRGPPQLVTLDKFDIAGAGACLKRYSDPSFFKINFASSGKMEPEIQREKRTRKLKKKGLRLKNGETLESLMKPDEDSKSVVSGKVSKSLSLQRVKLKARPVNSANAVHGRSYMESILYEQPNSNSLLYEDSFDQSLKTKLIESAPKMHEIMVDAVSLARKRGQVQHAFQQRAAEEDSSDMLKKKKDEHTTKEPLLKPENREGKVSSVVGSDNNDQLCDDSGTQGNNNYNGELGLKDSAEPNGKEDDTDVYVSDGVASELDAYVDALTTMDSENDTDSEGRTIPLPGLLNMKSQGMDSDIDEVYEHKVHLDSHSTECSSGMLDYGSLYKEKPGAVTGDCAGASSDILAYESNIATSYATEKSEGHSFVALSGDLGKTVGKDQDVASVDNGIYNDKELNESSVRSEFGLATCGSCIAVGKDQDVASVDNGNYNDKELNESSVRSEFGLATCSCIAGAASPGHGGPQAGTEETLPSLPYLNFPTEVCTSNGDPNPQQSIEEHSSNACLKTMHSEDVEDTTDVFEKSDMLSAGIRDVLSDTSCMKLCDMEDSNTSITGDFVNEGETSADCSMINEPEDAQIKVHFVPCASVPEEVNLENISTENFQELPQLAENCRNEPVTQYRKDDDGQIKVTNLVGESLCSGAEMLLKETDDVAGGEPRISGIQKPEMEPFSVSESEVFHDAKLQNLSSDNLQTDLPDGSSQMLDDAGIDDSVLLVVHSNPPTISISPETRIDAFSTDRNTCRYDLPSETIDIYDSNKDSSAVTSSNVPSVSELKLQGEFALHDSGKYMNLGKENETSLCSVESKQSHGLDSQKTVPSDKENNIMVLAEALDINTSVDNSSLNLSNAPDEYLIENGEVSLRCRTNPLDAVQASSVKHTSSSRLQDDSSSVLSTDENNQESSLKELTEGGTTVLSTQQQHNQQLEEAKVSNSSDPLPKSRVAVSAQKQIKASGIETDVIPEHHVLLLSDHQSSESPWCFNSVDKDWSESEKHVTFDKDDKAVLSSFESGQDHGLDSQKSAPSNKENNIMSLAKSHSIRISVDNSSLKLNNVPRENFIENEVNLSHANINVVGAYPSDSMQASDIKHSLFSRLQDDFSNVSVADENAPVSSSRTLVGAQQQHDFDDQQLEEAKVHHSSDTSPTSGDAIHTKTDVNASGIKTDVLPEYHICLLSDHSLESPRCTNYVDNDQSKPDKYVNFGQDKEVESHSVESIQGSDSVSSLHESLEDNTSPVSVPSMTTSIVRSPDCCCSASVEDSQAETQFNSPVTIDTSVNSGHDLSNGYNLQHIDIEAQFLSQSIANLSARSMGNDSDVDIELQKASSGLLATETSVLHVSSTIEHDMRIDNAPEQVETGTHAMHVCSHDDTVAKSTKSMADSFVLPCDDSSSNHVVVVADVQTRSDFETILETDNKLDVPVPNSPSFNFSIPEFPSELSHPVGYGQVFGIPIPDHNVLEGPVDEAPPLPPLPPLQWRSGKLHARSGMPTGATAGPSYSTPEPFSDLSPGYPNPLAVAEEAYHKNPSTHDIRKSDDVGFKHDCLNQEETRVNSNMLEGKNECGTVSLGGEIASPSHSFGEQKDPNEVNRQPENLFVPVAVSCNESDQPVSSSFTEPAKPLNSFVLIPVSEHSGPHGIEPTLPRKLVQPLNQYLFGSTVENGNYFYGRGDLGDERIQAIDVSAMQGVMPKDNSFMHGGKDAYVSYSLFSAVDSGKPNGGPRSILNRPRDPLIEAVASHDKSTLRKVSEMAQTSSKPKVDERDTLLEQIRNKSFNLKPAVTTKPKVSAPSGNLKVAAILEKANAIRQAFVGSDEDDDDSWSDC